MEFKKISDVEILDSATDSTNVLVEQDGEIKRVPRTEVGRVSTINGVEPDENGNVEIVAGVQSDLSQNDEKALDYVKNRTHYVKGKEYSDVLHWEYEGSFDGYEKVVFFEEDGYRELAYKVSDATPTPEDLDDHRIVWMYADGSVEGEVEYYLSSGDFYDLRSEEPPLPYVINDDGIMIVYETFDYGDDGNQTFTPGVWVLAYEYDDVYVEHTISVGVYENIKTISKKFLPPDIPSLDDVADSLSGYARKSTVYTKDEINNAMNDIYSATVNNDETTILNEFRSMTWDGNVEGLCKVRYNAMNYWKVSDIVLTPEQIIGSSCKLIGNLIPNGQNESISEDKIVETSGSCATGHILSFATSGTHTIVRKTSDGRVMEYNVDVLESGTYFLSNDTTYDRYVTELAYRPRVRTSFELASSTAGSTKTFRITVDDSGTISAIEVQ